MSSTLTRNRKAKLASDYNDLLKEFSSHEMTSVGYYSIGETIGEGTFGKVKLGTHKLTGRQVAIKKISKQHASMLAREIHHHRQLRHPNIVTLYEVVVTESSIFVISEFCSHGELFDALMECGRCSERQAAKWFRQLAEAIKFCHMQGIIHRDLKLENILLDAEDNIKLCDFGFARQADNRQLLETFCGSLAYSAPEVILRQKYSGPETDIWSLGVILYTLLAGELPFDDDSEIITQRKIVNVDYTIPSYFSPEATDLIRRIIVREPSNRLTIDQILNHPWLQQAVQEDEVQTDCWDSSSITRQSSQSDLDSVFSGKRFRLPLSTEEDDECSTDLSSYGSYSSSPDRNNNRWTPRSPHRQSPPECAKFSPQVRYSLGMTKHMPTTPRLPPRFSLPAAAAAAEDRSLLSPPLSPYRASLPPSSQPNGCYREAAATRLDEIPMTVAEYQLATALVAAGFDEQAITNMRTNTCDSLNGLWKLLLDKISKKSVITEGSRVTDGFVAAMHQEQHEKVAQMMMKLPARYVESTLNAMCNTTRPEQNHRCPVDAATQTSADISVKTDQHQQTVVHNSDAVDNGIQEEQHQQSLEKGSGWLSSVKSWFGSKPAAAAARTEGSAARSRKRQSHRTSQSFRNIDPSYFQDKTKQGPWRYWDDDVPRSTPESSQVLDQERYRRRMLQLGDSTVTDLNPPASRRTDRPISKPSSYEPEAVKTPSRLKAPPAAVTAPHAPGDALATQRLHSLKKAQRQPLSVLEPPRPSAKRESLISRPPAVAPPSSAATLDAMRPTPSAKPAPIESPTSPVYSESSSSSSSSEDEENYPALFLPSTSSLAKIPEPQHVAPSDLPSSPPFKIMPRADFAPRSRLSVYGMNQGLGKRSPLGSKAIIEEEEEEE